jgi:hypothetical protein
MGYGCTEVFGFEFAFNIHLRTEVSQACNDRYLESLGNLNVKKPLSEITESVTKHTLMGDQRIRALNPWTGIDFKILSIIGNGDYLINGFQNKDLRVLLLGGSKDDKEKTFRKSITASQNISSSWLD